MTMNTIRRLADVAEVRAGYLTKKPVRPRPDGTHHLLQIRDFNGDRSSVAASAMVRFVPDSLSSVRPLQTGDVVFLARGTRNFAFAATDLPDPSVAASYFFVIHPGEQMLPGYLAWCLNQPDTLRALARSATSGAHMPVVRRADIENVQVPVPPIHVQQAIMHLDGLMREEQAMMDELARKRRDLISTVCMATANPLSPTGERK
jgi:hypothetical protein